MADGMRMEKPPAQRQDCQAGTGRFPLWLGPRLSQEGQNAVPMHQSVKMGDKDGFTGLAGEEEG